VGVVAGRVRFTVRRRFIAGAGGVTDARICAVDGCDRPHEARGWCKSHYQRWLRTGDHPAGAIIQPGDDNLPNPWALVAPPCPWGHDPAEVYLWHDAPEDGLGRWLCQPCGRRFGAELRAVDDG
jgi:hypothetical protein